MEEVQTPFSPTHVDTSKYARRRTFFSFPERRRCRGVEVSCSQYAGEEIDFDRSQNFSSPSIASSPPYKQAENGAAKKKKEKQRREFGREQGKKSRQKSKGKRLRHESEYVQRKNKAVRKIQERTETEGDSEAEMERREAESVSEKKERD